jgi:hypothetical protein
MKKLIERWISEKWTVGQYAPSETFKQIENHSCVCRPDLGLIAIAGRADDPEAQALSDLISTSPELLMALKKLVFQAEMVSLSLPHVVLVQLIQEIENARRVIAKAEGDWCMKEES